MIKLISATRNNFEIFMQNVLWNLILKSNRIIEYKIWENFLNIIIQQHVGHFPRISCHSTILEMALFQGSWYIQESWKNYSESTKRPGLLFLKKWMNRELWVIQNLNCYVIATGMIFVLFCSKKPKQNKQAKNNIIPMPLSFFQSVFSERLFSIS